MSTEDFPVAVDILQLDALFVRVTHERRSGAERQLYTIYETAHAETVMIQTSRGLAEQVGLVYFHYQPSLEAEMVPVVITRGDANKNPVTKVLNADDLKRHAKEASGNPAAKTKSSEHVAKRLIAEQLKRVEKGDIFVPKYVADALKLQYRKPEKANLTNAQTTSERHQRTSAVAAA